MADDPSPPTQPFDGARHSALPEHLESRLVEVLDRPEAEQDTAVEALCREHTAHAAELWRALAMLRRLSAAHETPPSPAAILGRLTQLGPYRILGKIGQGGAGSVYAAEHVELARKVALKTIRPDYLDNEVARHRFRREMLALTRLEHPHICRVYEVGEDQGVPFMALQHLDGEDLGHRIWHARSGGQGPGPSRCVPLPSVTDGTDTATKPSTGQRLRSEIDRVVFLFEKVARAVHVAHSAGLVHRDLKPGNIMVTPAGEPVVLDFGLARSTEGDESRLSRSGDVLGTVEYMAPEQAAGRTSQVDRRSDVYALGVSLYEALCLELPFTADSRQETLVRIIHDQAVLLNRRNRAVSRDLAVIVGKAMEKESGRRYQTAVELAEDLRRVRAHEPVQARPVSVIGRVERWTRRNPLAAALIATFAIGLGVSSWQFLRAEGTAVSLKQRTDQFDQLAGVVLYERAIAEEAALYPAWPHKIEAMETWLTDAGKLLEMRPEIQRTVRDLESRSLPQTVEEQEADRRLHPRLAEFELLGQRVASWRYAQAIRGGTAVLVVPELTAEQRALDAEALNALAWPRVAPPARAGVPEQRTVYGEEAMALAWARAAVAKAYGTDAECRVLDTLAWALLANGQDAEAKAQSAEALANAPGNDEEAYRSHQRDLEAAITQAAAELAEAEQQLVQLTAAVSERQTWRFGTTPAAESARFLHETLVDLLGKLGSLKAKEKAEVDQRLAWAKQVVGLSLGHPKARHQWPDVRSAIAANAKYAGQTIELRDRDITGLVPIGENPVTHLWEFYELRSAWDGKGDPREIVIPEHKPDGSIEVTGETGIVFVLLPGGTFTMGAQNYDPGALSNERPQEVTLAPFFLARHELTQGQWARLWTWDASLRDPSHYKRTTNFLGGRMTLAHPVEQVDWTMCDTVMTRHGLVLPTEAQWEYGCRGGTTTPWVVDREKLVEVANLADATAREGSSGWTYEEWRDGHVVHAPVGSFAMNGFGLYDVHGNVWEWCRDWYGDYGSERAGDGLRSGSGSSIRCARGGSFSDTASYARSAFRYSGAPSFRHGLLGLRPTRTSTP